MIFVCEVRDCIRSTPATEDADGDRIVRVFLCFELKFEIISTKTGITPAIRQRGLDDTIYWPINSCNNTLP